MTERVQHPPRPRIQGLSDLVFGLALSIGSIGLVSSVPENGNQVLATLAVFGFSFLILMNLWNRYTVLVSAVPVETGSMVRLNMILLFLVSIEPYLFNLLARFGLGLPLGPDVSALYALDIAGMNFVLAYFAYLLTQEERKLIPANLLHRFKVTRNSIFIGGVIFAISAIPQFGNPSYLPFGETIRIWIWLLAIPVIGISRMSAK